MSDDKDKNPLYRGPSPKRDGNRERGPRPPRRFGSEAEHQVRRRESEYSAPVRQDYSDDLAQDARPAKIKEFRIYGLNACLAAFKKRPESLRKVWLLSARIPKVTELLAYCVKNKIGYNVVESEDLEKLTASAHHEGICLAMLPQPELNLSAWLMTQAAGPQLLIWLDGVGNPHNLGAILRSAAHFGVGAVLLPKESMLANSGAAARVAEGAAEYVPLVRLGRSENAVAQLKSAGFEFISAVVRGGDDIFKTQLPERCVLVMGAEQTGVEPTLLQASRLRVQVPGTGHVESLNVSAATAVLLAEWSRQTRA